MLHKGTNHNNGSVLDEFKRSPTFPMRKCPRMMAPSKSRRGRGLARGSIVPLPSAVWLSAEGVPVPPPQGLAHSRCFPSWVSGPGSQGVVPGASAGGLQQAARTHAPSSPFPNSSLVLAQHLQNHLIFTDFFSLITAHITQDK